MNKFFFDNFDTDSTGALPAWFSAIQGTWQVVSDPSIAYSGSNVLQNISHADGDKVLLKGGGGITIPATADMAMTYVTESYNNANAGMQPILRSDATAQNYYVFLVYGSAGDVAFQLYKCVSGSLSAVGGLQSTGVTYQAGQPLFVNVNCTGTTIGARVWYTGSDPGTNQISVTDGSITAAGYAGWYNAGSGATAGNGIDNMQLSGTSSLATGTISTTGTTATTISLSAAAPSGGTPSYTYQWYRSATSGFVPDTATKLSGATALTVTDTGLTAATTYYYLLVATDSAGVIAWSSQYSQATAAGYASDFSLSPSSLTTYAGVATGNYSVTLASAPSSSTTIALSDGGAGGAFTPSSLTFTGAGSQTFTYTPSGSASPGNITLTASASGGFSASHATSCTVASAAGAGTVYATYVGVTKVQLSGSFPTGGSGSFTFQWYRSTASGSTGAAISGATAESLIDTGLSGATSYYYTLAYQDTAGGSPVNSTQVAVTTLAPSNLEVIGGIGDSIMEGAYSTVETPFNAMIDQLSFKITTKQFVGDNQAISGTTSGNWSSTSSGSDLLNAVSSFNTAGVTRVVMMLGTNDSKSDVATSPSTYASNISTIIAYLFANVSTLKSVHLFSSPYQSFAESSGGDLTVGNCGRIIQYSTELATLANGSTIFFKRPLNSYNFFQNNPALLRDGIHPTDEGDQSVGAMWAEDVIDALYSGSSPAGVRRSGFQGGFLQ